MIISKFRVWRRNLIKITYLVPLHFCIKEPTINAKLLPFKALLRNKEKSNKFSNSSYLLLHQVKSNVKNNPTSNWNFFYDSSWFAKLFSSTIWNYHLMENNCQNARIAMNKILINLEFIVLKMNAWTTWLNLPAQIFP